MDTRKTSAPVLQSATLTRVEQLVADVRWRIDQRLWRPGTRLPSIREQAAARGVSRFTVVDAYDRLAALGLIEARHGAGYFVRGESVRPRTAAVAPVQSSIDVVWLLRNMLASAAAHQPPERSPGMGFLPPDWFDPDLLGAAVRAVGRAAGPALLGSGVAEGYLPLRETLAGVLAARDISAAPEQIVLTTGVTQAIDLVVREFVQPGDTVFVEDPAWFLMFGRFAQAGVRLVGVPRLAEGPDTRALEELAQRHRPRLMVVNSVCHNPTSSVLSAACAHEVLRIAQAHDFLLVEDDIYGDLAPPTLRATRLAALDRWQRVMYCCGFSKTLAPNLRVGALVASPDRAARLLEHKLLGGMTTPELNERVLYQLLSSPRYRKQVVRLRGRLDEQREKAIRTLRRVGVVLADTPTLGMFLWADLGRDTNELAARGHHAGIVMAPGALFSPSQQPSTFMRFNVATSTHPQCLALLREGA